MVSFVAGAGATTVPGIGDISGMIYTCAILELIFGIFALVGATMAFSGRSWGIALMGAIFCLLSVGFLFLGSLFGLLGLIFIAISREEFEGATPPPYRPQYGQPAYQYDQQPMQGYQQGYQQPYYPDQYPPQEPPPPY
jgi:hypothetical protein